MTWFLAVCAALYAVSGHTEPVMKADLGEEISVILYSTSCTLSAVVNLPGRAVWIEKSVKTEGCFGVDRLNIVQMYFADRTVVTLPIRMFSRVSGA